MKLAWTEEAIADVNRQRSFIGADNPEAADRIAQAILNAAKALEAFLELGKVVEGLSVRVLIEGQYRYKLVYEMDAATHTVRILGVFHPRQSRP